MCMLLADLRLVELFPFWKLLASSAASLASLSASSFPAMEICTGAQLIYTVVPASCSMLMAQF